MESPAGSGDDATAAVCCMCGDRGLPGELFQCGLCRRRLQHRYCSELYPREAAYRTCNWCLREEGSGGRNPPVKKTSTPAVASERRGLKRSRQDYGDMMSPSYGRCSRTVFSAVPGKPVKKFMKKKAPGRMMEQRPVTTMAAANGRREVQAGAGRKARFRVKVRRYKLLTEVTC